MLYTLVFFACLGGSLFGYDTGVISGAMIQISSKSVGLALSDQQQEMVVSITTAGAFAGALLSGPGNSRFGRRPMIILASIVFTAGAMLLAVAGSYQILLIGRVIVGLGVGVASHTVPMYIAEAAPTHMRGTLVTLNNIFIVLGQVIASLVDCAFVLLLRLGATDTDAVAVATGALTGAGIEGESDAVAGAVADGGMQDTALRSWMMSTWKAVVEHVFAQFSVPRAIWRASE